jgi:hypothetical protein
MLSWVHLPYICWVCLLNKCEISNCYCCAMTRFGIKLCEKNTIIFNSDLKSVSVLSNVDRKYYQCIPKKRARRSDFKAEMYSWLIQRRYGTIASLSFCQKTIIICFVCFCFENISSTSQRTSRCRNWVASPLAASITCCLTRQTSNNLLIWNL